MYKLLKPTHIGINYMVEKLQEYISQIGHEQIQSLKGENVCLIFCLNELIGNFFCFFSYQHYLLKLYLNYIRNI